MPQGRVCDARPRLPDGECRARAWLLGWEATPHSLEGRAGERPLWSRGVAGERTEAARLSPRTCGGAGLAVGSARNPHHPWACHRQADTRQACPTGKQLCEHGECLVAAGATAARPLPSQRRRGTVTYFQFCFVSPLRGWGGYISNSSTTKNAGLLSIFRTSKDSVPRKFGNYQNNKQKVRNRPTLQRIKRTTHISGNTNVNTEHKLSSRTSFASPQETVLPCHRNPRLVIITSSDRSPQPALSTTESHNNGQEAAGALGSGPGDTAEKDDRAVCEPGRSRWAGWARVGLTPPRC